MLISLGHPADVEAKASRYRALAESSPIALFAEPVVVVLVDPVAFNRDALLAQLTRAIAISAAGHAVELFAMSRAIGAPAGAAAQVDDKAAA